MESRIDKRVCFASILTLSLIWLDRGTVLWRTPTVAANDTPLLTLLGITDEDTWNMDETGFCIGVDKAQYVVSRHRIKALVMTDPDNRDYITAVETISAAGAVIPPIVILAAKQILDKWAANDIEDNAQIGVSDSGYSNDDLALEWMKHFEKELAKVQQGDFRLLLMDGYGSHLTYEFWSYAKDHKIALWRLPPYATHLLQPLDVGIFQPMKHWHQEALDSCIRLGDSTFDKQDFLASFQWIQDKTFTRSNILSAWRKAGLVSYNPQLITDSLESLNRKRLRDITPPPVSANEIMSHTPQTAKDVVERGKRIMLHY